MWLTGFDQLMPEGRKVPYKFFPKRGVHLGIHFGQPVSADEIYEVLADSASSSDKIRSDITALIQRDLESLGRGISGDMLGKR